MQMKKYWTIKNGVLGTAHINRDGREVDFRHADILFNPANLFSESDAVVAMSKDGNNSCLVCNYRPVTYHLRQWSLSQQIYGDCIASIIISLNDCETRPIEIPGGERFGFIGYSIN